MQLGWMHDVEMLGPGQPAVNTRVTAVRRDLRSLFEDYGATMTVTAGDLNIGDAGDVPHVTDPTRYDVFWELARELGVEDRVWAVPGNHDVPVQPFFDAHPNAVWRRQFEFPEVNTAVFLLNTAAPAAVTGSHGLRDQGGVTAVGVDHGYVPHTDLLWLEEQLEMLPQHWTKILFSHHHLYWSDDESLDTYSPEPAHRAENFYDVVLNARRVHDLLSRHDRILVCQAHLFQSGSAGYTLADGVSYVYKSHYRMNQGYTTFGVLDVRPDRTRVLTVDHQSRDETVIFDSQEVDGW